MAKRDKVLSEEAEPVDSTTKLEVAPDTTTAAESADEKMARLEAMIQAQAQRLAESEARRTAAETQATEAKERVKAMAQAQATAVPPPPPRSQRPSSVITSEVLEHEFQPPQVFESTRRKVRPGEVRLARGRELGDCSHTLFAANLRESGRCEIHVTLPDHARLEFSKDAYAAVFEDGYARVSGPIAEILLSQDICPYERVN